MKLALLQAWVAGVLSTNQICFGELGFLASNRCFTSNTSMKVRRDESRDMFLIGKEEKLVLLAV